MPSIEITVTTDLAVKLQDMAERLGLSQEEIVRLSIEQMVDQLDDSFQQAMDEVLAAHAALYKRLD